MSPQASAPARRRNYLDAGAIAVTGVVLIIAVVGLARHSPIVSQVLARFEGRLEATPLEGAQIPLPRPPFAGNPSAPLVVMEFSDPLCAACRTLDKAAMPALRAELVDAGRLQWHVRTLPTAAASAPLQLLRRVCAVQQRLKDAPVGAVPPATGFDPGVFDVCLAGGGRAILAEDQTVAEALNITSTPTLLMGRLDATSRSFTVRHVVTGARPFEDLEALLRQIEGPPGA